MIFYLNLGKYTIFGGNSVPLNEYSVKRYYGTKNYMILDIGAMCKQLLKKFEHFPEMFCTSVNITISRPLPNIHYFLDCCSEVRFLSSYAVYLVSLFPSEFSK